MNLAKFHSVESVRAAGNQVKVFHRRLYWTINKKGVPEKVLLPSCCVDDLSKALPRGGCTTVVVTTPTGETFTGWSECCENDPYDKKRGVRIALHRAMLGSGS